MMRLDARIFDVDGTPADSAQAHRHAPNRALLDSRPGWSREPAFEARRALHAL